MCLNVCLETVCFGPESRALCLLIYVTAAYTLTTWLSNHLFTLAAVFFLLPCFIFSLLLLPSSLQAWFASIVNTTGMSGVLKSMSDVNAGEARGKLPITTIKVLGVPLTATAERAVVTLNGVAAPGVSATVADGVLTLSGLNLIVGERMEVGWSLA